MNFLKNLFTGFFRESIVDFVMKLFKAKSFKTAIKLLKAEAMIFVEQYMEEELTSEQKRKEIAIHLSEYAASKGFVISSSIINLIIEIAYQRVLVAKGHVV